VSNQRFEGHNLEEALTQAASAMGVERFQLTYHVVLEKRGFLGGTKRVVIEAQINDSAVEAPSRPAPAVLSVPPPGESAPRERSSRGEQSDDLGGNRGRRGRGGRGRGSRSEGRMDVGAESFPDAGPVEPAPEQGPESEQVKVARVWCERVIELGHFELEVRSSESDEEIHLHLYGRDVRKATDRNGELLDSFQVLANKALVGRKVEKSIELNCAGFKERRLEDLGQRARELADRVRSDGHEQMLPAMSPIERRIVHVALQDDTQVTTESRGDGFYKRVAIIRRSPSDQPVSGS
jgi:spoIIIJ-associated protein